MKTVEIPFSPVSPGLGRPVTATLWFENVLFRSQQAERYQKNGFHHNFPYWKCQQSFLHCACKIIFTKFHLCLETVSKNKEDMEDDLLTSRMHYPFLRMACLSSWFRVWLKWIGFQIRCLRPMSGPGCACDALRTLPSVPLVKPAPLEAKFLRILKVQC